MDAIHRRACPQLRERDPDGIRRNAALGCGLDKNFDPARLRYGKIIILADADSDGHHLATLLLTFIIMERAEEAEELDV